MKYSLFAVAVLFVFSNSFGNDSTLTVKRGQTASAEKRISEIKSKNAVYQKCFGKYEQEIRNRTDTLEKQLQKYIYQEQETLKRKSSNDSEIKSIQSEIKNTKMELESAKTSKNADKSSRMNSLRKKRNAAERRILADPGLVEIRKSIARTKKQINQIIQEIVKSDAECLGCMKMKE
ncbi:MAG: hypothetical protein PHC61_00940 [Chitinivibrionales bacterium]|nr:hypothetical protein [Chitinivibrionales bacterium]